MCFLKSRERDQVAQEEYRFILLSIGDEVGDGFDLPVSGMLKDCLLPVRYPEGKAAEATALVQKDEGPGGEERIPGKRTHIDGGPHRLNGPGGRRRRKGKNRRKR